jgi:hypothetical protein
MLADAISPTNKTMTNAKGDRPGPAMSKPACSAISAENEVVDQCETPTTNTTSSITATIDKVKFAVFFGSLCAQLSGRPAAPADGCCHGGDDVSRASPSKTAADNCREPFRP